ncbi:MAG TPA: hypothetical protein PKK48_03890 [Phycisphaerae bacterium]|nr:hypothetical protein [Phycisphaerae bacterium]HPS52950.1 hypothetical protein [Phycisphaerae bacterium]
MKQFFREAVFRAILKRNSFPAEAVEKATLLLLSMQTDDGSGTFIKLKMEFFEKCSNTLMPVYWELSIGDPFPAERGDIMRNEKPHALLRLASSIFLRRHLRTDFIQTLLH